MPNRLWNALNGPRYGTLKLSFQKYMSRNWILARIYASSSSRYAYFDFCWSAYCFFNSVLISISPLLSHNFLESQIAKHAVYRLLIACQQNNILITTLIFLNKDMLVWMFLLTCLVKKLNVLSYTVHTDRSTFACYPSISCNS